MYGFNTCITKVGLAKPSSFKYLRICLRLITQSRLQNSSLPEVVEKDTSSLYPPIEDTSKSLQLKKMKRDWHLKIKNLPTVEQKTIELNMPKYYGYYSVILKKETINLNSLDFIKFATRTQIIENFPSNYYEEETGKLEKIIGSVKEPVENLISLHFGNKISRDTEGTKEVKSKETICQNFITDLNRLLIKVLKEDLSHLSVSSVDLEPRIEGFWFVGGFELPRILKNRYKNKEHLKEFADEHYDRAFRSSVKPALALRCGEGLPEVVPQDCLTGEISSPKGEDAPLSEVNPLNCYPHETDTKIWGFLHGRKHAVIVPGFWPGEKDEYGHTFYHTRSYEYDKMRNFTDYDGKALENLLLQNLVVAGFTQALSYSFYQGFTPVNELTYPVVQQSVSTDGQKFRFGVYQMNTCCLHSELSLKNPRINYLWLSEDLNLYDSIEGSSVKGLNEDVLKMLCLQYLKKGVPRENPSPYLAPYKYLMHHDAPGEYKEEFHEIVHNLLSERPKRVVKPEITPWEMIYKIYFKTRPMERKMKFFENRWKMNPYKRRLDEYSPVYIPKVRRIAHRIKFKPRIHSEELFKHDFRTLKRLVVYPDDGIVYKSMNVRKDTPPYFNGLMWSRGMANRHRKL